MSRPGTLHVFVDPGDRFRFYGGDSIQTLDLTDLNGSAEWSLFLPGDAGEAALILDSLETALLDARRHYATQGEEADVRPEPFLGALAPDAQ